VKVSERVKKAREVLAERKQICVNAAFNFLENYRSNPGFRDNVRYRIVPEETMAVLHKVDPERTYWIEDSIRPELHPTSTRDLVLPRCPCWAVHEVAIDALLQDGNKADKKKAERLLVSCRQGGGVLEGSKKLKAKRRRR
jgi:hypothetical protein